MAEWWSELSTLASIYWIIAIVSTTILSIFLVLSFVGGDVDADLGDVDADVSGDVGIGFQFLSLKSFLGFASMFGWTGIVMLDNGSSTGASLIAAFLAGFVMMAAIAGLFYLMAKMVEDGTLDVQNAVNAVGEVYMTIGKERSSIGKVQVKVQGGLRTMEALSDAEEDLTQGTVISVKEVLGSDILLVEKLKK